MTELKEGFQVESNAVRRIVRAVGGLSQPAIQRVFQYANLEITKELKMREAEVLASGTTDSGSNGAVQQADKGTGLTSTP